MTPKKTSKKIRSDKGIVKSQLREVVLKLHYEGICPSDIARKIGITPSGVSYHLNKEGIHVPKTKKLHDLTEAINLYQSGWSLAAVSRKVGMTDECLRRRFDRAGIPRRTLKESVPRGKNNIHYKDGLSGERNKIRDKIKRKTSWQVAAICLGHPLVSGWVVHHLDENPDNNNPENLWIFPDIASHAHYHAQLTDALQKGLSIDTTQLALRNGALKLPPPPSPIVFEHDINPRDLFEKLRQRIAGRKE